MTKKQGGFGVIEIVIILAVLLVLGFIGWAIFNKSQTTNSSGTNPNNTNDSNDRQTFYSKLGGLSFSYPKGWVFDNNSNKPDENENSMRLTNKAINSADGKVKDTFALQIEFKDSPYTKDSFSLYPNGSLTRLENGIELWEEKESINYFTGPAKSKCPSMQVASNNYFGMQPSNGRYLYVKGTYCWGQGAGTTLSYEQQKDSQAYKQAVEIVKSIKYN